MSICSLWCCAAALLLTDWPFHRSPATRPKQSPPQPGCPQSITHTSYAHTNTQWPLQSQSYCCWGLLNGPSVTLGPLHLIRCYNQTTKGLWHRDLLSILHTLTEQDKSLRVCVCAEGCYADKRRKPSMRTIREAFHSPWLVNYVKYQGATVNYCGDIETPPPPLHSNKSSTWET